MSKSTYYLFGRILRAPLSISILAFGFMLVPTVAAASIQLPESCRMGSCSRATVESKEALRTNNLGTLYSVTKIVEQYPPNPQSSYYSQDMPELAQQDYKRFINYHGSDFVSETSQDYVFCSKELPSVMFDSDDGYRVNRLAIFESPFGYNRWAYQQYLATCHNLAGPDYFSLNVYSLLLREGYTDRYISQSNQFVIFDILDVMRPTQHDG